MKIRFNFWWYTLNAVMASWTCTGIVAKIIVNLVTDTEADRWLSILLLVLSAWAVYCVTEAVSELKKEWH